MATLGLAVFTAAFAQPASLANAVGPQVTDLVFTSNPKTFITNGDAIVYTISFKMPSDLTGYDALRIVDIIPAGLRCQPRTATLKIDGGSGQIVTWTGSLPTSPQILILDASHFGGNFEDAADSEIELTIQMQVFGWATGKPISNVALLYFRPAGGSFPSDPDASAEKIISPARWNVSVHVNYVTNGATGLPPYDASLYEVGTTITVLGNVGSPPLSRPGYTLIGWERSIVPVVLVSQYALSEMGPGFTLTGTGEPGYLIKFFYVDVANGTILTQSPTGIDLTQEIVTVDADGRWEYEIPNKFGNEFSGLGVGGDYLNPDMTPIFYGIGAPLKIPQSAFNSSATQRELTLYPVWAPIVEPDGPPSDVYTSGDNRRVGLIWNNAGEGGAVRYEVKYYPVGSDQSVIDSTPWQNILLADMTLLSNIGKYCYLYPNLTNGVEYMFEVRAYDSAGIVGVTKKVTGTPNPVGNIGGEEADLFSIHGVNVMPAGGWPATGGDFWYNAYRVTVTMPASIPLIFNSTSTIDISTDAEFEMYSDAGFTNKTTMINRYGASGIGTVVVYIRVVSGNQENWKYYAVTIVP